MTSTQNHNRLQTQLANIIALEAANEQRLLELIPEVSAHAGATALLTGFQDLARDQRQALETRLKSIQDIAPISNNITVALPVNGLSQRERYPVSTALQIIYTIFNQAVIGYSVLHPLATRFLDSPYTADEGTSYHLARQHTENYIHAIQQISRLLHDVVLWELDSEELECQCTCPSCGVGICLCAMAGRSFLSDAWQEAGPIADDEGIYVQLPKEGSAAIKAGLCKGDVILAVDGQELASYGDLQNAVRNSEPGDEIRLTVRRGSDDLQEISVTRS
ncbi:MAG: PDZ domain-containing protein [Gammaproteobacteria bacterium]|nr:PDZ domain-containing protein [Gammaproteobacteria bacterium]